MTRRPRPKGFLSGQAGTVVLIEGQTCMCRRMGEAEYRPCRREDIAYFFAEASDVIAVSGKSPEQAYRLLEHEWTLDRALHLTLILLDRDAHLRAKRIATERLETFLNAAETKAFIVHRLYARPLPASADVPDALRLCIESSRKTVWGMLTVLREDQQRIIAVRERWERLDEQLFGGHSEKRCFEQIAIEEGLFFALARAHPVQRWFTNPRVKKLQYCERVINAWAPPLLAPPKVLPQSEQIALFPEHLSQKG